MSVKQRLERLIQVRLAQQMAALERLLELFTPEEAVALVATLEADLIGQPVPLDIERKVDVAFARVWPEVTTEERALLVSSTTAGAW